MRRRSLFARSLPSFEKDTASLKAPTDDSLGRLSSIPTEVVGSDVQFSHCWVQVNVGTVDDPDWVVMDPSFKTYDTTAGIDIGTTIGYDQATFLSYALSGATVTADSNSNRGTITNQITLLAKGQ